MARFSRDDLQTRYEMFHFYGLDDQRNYYQKTRERYRKAAAQVNFLRALVALFTGMSAAAAGLITQYAFIGNGICTVEDVPAICSTLEVVTALFTILAVVLPALGALFNNLADLYQWDRLADVFERAESSLEVADALSPLDNDDDESYEASLRAYAEGTLSVMSDETAQWGQSIRTPEQLKEFIDMERKKAQAQYARFLDTFDMRPPNTTDTDNTDDEGDEGDDTPPSSAG